MDYEVLSPMAEVDPVTPRNLQPRVTDLSGKTIGLFAFFKQWGPPIMKEVEKQLQEKLPAAKFSHYHCPLYLEEVATHDKYRASFEDWVKGVDTVVTGHGD